MMAQRLIRVLCPACKEIYEPSDEELREIGVTRDELRDGRVFRAKGCSECAGRGYHGRSGIFELLRMTPQLQQLVNERADSNVVRRTAIEQGGFRTLRQDGAQRVVRGVTSIEEVLRVSRELVVTE